MKIRIATLAALATTATSATANCETKNVDFIVLEGDATLKALEDDIRADLEAVGVKVTTRLLAKDPFNEAMVAGDFNMAFSETWGPPYDPHSYAKSWTAPDEAHFAALKGLPAPLTQAVLGEKIDDVLATEDIQSRQSQWKDILTGLHEQAIDLPFAGKRIPAVINKRLSGYRPGNQQFEYPVHYVQVLSGSKSITVAPGGQTGLFAGVGRLDPHTYRPNEFFSNNWVYEGLIEYGEDGVLLPSLAQSWTIDDNADGGQTYTFALREGVTFTDGQMWNCSVAKLNFDNVLAPPLTTADWHGWYGLPEQVNSWSCNGAYEFVVNTKEKYYPLLQELSYIRPLRMLSPAMFVGGLANDPLKENSCHVGWGVILGDINVTCAGTLGVAGTGRWTVVDPEGDANGNVVFNRNTNHWGPAQGDVEKMTLVKYEDHAAVKAALLDGSLDLVVGSGVLEPKDIYDFQTKHTNQFDVAMTESFQNMIVVINAGKAPTDELRTRKTIIHGVNKAAMIDKELYGMSDAIDALFPKTAPYCHIDLTPRWDYDLEKAEMLNCGLVVSDGVAGHDDHDDHGAAKTSEGVSTVVIIIVVLVMAGLAVGLFFAGRSRGYQNAMDVYKEKREKPLLTASKGSEESPAELINLKTSD